MSLEQGLVSVLDVTPQIAGGRVFPRLPQPAVFPAVRYQLITTTRTQAIDGPVGVTEAMLQLDCMARSYTEAKAVAAQVRTVLHGYRGAWGDLKAHLVHLQSENDFSEQDGDRITHWVTQRYQVWTDMQ